MPEDRVRAPEGDKAYEAFFQAAADGDEEKLKAALLPSLDVNALESDEFQGRSALHIAAECGNVIAIDFLLARGAQVDLKDSIGETPLHIAAAAAEPGAVRALLDAGAELNRPTGDYLMTALHNVMDKAYCVTPDIIETITVLLDRGADINSPRDHWGTTIVSPCSLILNPVTDSQLTCYEKLSQACGLYDLDFVRLLVDRGASMQDVLSSAIQDIAITKFLLERGANISSAPPKKGSALVDAAGGGNEVVLKILLDHASESDMAASATALHQAAHAGDIENAEILLNHGFDANSFIRNHWIGETPLLATCTMTRRSLENLAVVKLLIQRGADPHLRGTDGKSAEEIWLGSKLAESYRREIATI